MSAAVAVGAVAMASGLVPGDGYQLGGGNDSAGQVQAGGPTDSGLETQGSQSAAPTDRGSVPPSRGDDRPHAPSTTPSKPPSQPSRTPSTTPPEQPGSSAPSGHGGNNGKNGNNGNGKGGSKGGGHGKPSRTPTTAPAPPAESAGPETASETEVLTLVNEEREKVGCAPVTADPKLAQLAEDFSEDMSLRQFFDHISPDGDSPWDRAESAGILDLGGENIARGQSDAQAVMDSWMNSSGHRANILNCSFKRLGVGTHFGTGGPWWTQDFGY